MNFGSDEFYRRLKQELCSPNNWEITLELEREVKKVATSTARHYFSNRTDVEDAAQTATGKVLTVAIHTFLEDAEMEYSDELHRLRWLRKVVKNAIIDEVRRSRARDGVWVPVGQEDAPSAESDGWRIIRPGDQPAEKTGRKDAGDGKPKPKDKRFIRNGSLDGGRDDEYAPGDFIPSDEPEFAETMFVKQMTEGMLRTMFAMDNIGVEKLITAGFCMLLNGYGHDYGAKKLNENVAKLLSGRTVQENMTAIKYLIYELNFPADAVVPLEARLSEPTPEGGCIADRIMKVSTRTVTQQVSDMRTRVWEVYQNDDNVVAFRAPEEEEDHE